MNLRFISLATLFAIALPALLLAQPQPDTYVTAQDTLTVQPIHHGTLALDWNKTMIYVDPTGGSEAFSDLAAPDMVLITHAHGDHFDPETLARLPLQDATIIMPASVADKMPQSVGGQHIVLANDEAVTQAGATITALPMYNLPEEGARHPKGWGNGYLLQLGPKRVYISGDTEGIPEMRTLSGIDIAFVCMNLPYTMDVTQAADAVLDFAPATVYPYHYRGQDTQQFKSLVHAGNKQIEVKLRDWYQ